MRTGTGVLELYWGAGSSGLVTVWYGQERSGCRVPKVSGVGIGKMQVVMLEKERTGGKVPSSVGTCEAEFLRDVQGGSMSERWVHLEEPVRSRPAAKFEVVSRWRCGLRSAWGAGFRIQQISMQQTHEM